MVLFQAVSKFHGYRNVTQANGWGQVSQALQFVPQHAPNAPQQLKAIYERNLLKFEEAWMSQQKTRIQQQGMANMAHMPQGAAAKGAPHNQMQPGQMMQPGQQPHVEQGQMQTPVKQALSQSPAVNGFSPTQASHVQQQQQQGAIAPGHARNSLSRSVQATPTGDEFPVPSPAQSKVGALSLPGTAHHDANADTAAAMRFPAPFNSNPEEYFPCAREILTYGGVDIPNVARLASELERWKPDIPSATELGNIDIHALTKSIQSGIHAEIRLALDTMASVTVSPQQNLYLDLRYCDDLVETLIECAEDQVDALVENTVEVSDEILIDSYEEVARSCRLEKMALRNVPAFGSPDYHLDRAVDRLICITTILRNLSFYPDNQKSLAEDTVVKFLCVVIRYLGTRNMLLRTQANTMDFMKDVIVLLSNVSAEVEIPGREQALCLLQFLLAFAPSPGPTLSNDKLFFTPYEPALQPYLPPAIDSLAKLLARDEPNRTHYKAILTSDALANPAMPHELLTRTFALATSVIPDQSRDKRSDHLPTLVDARRPLLMQGLLAADIVASLAPGHESGLTRAWLTSGNGFAPNLFWHIRTLSVYFDAQRPRPGAAGRHQPKKDTELVYIVGLAVSMLKKLCEKARDPNAPAGHKSIPPNVLPSRDSVLGALQMSAHEWTEQGMLADLVAYAALED
jgi:SWI/SNF chromatin-remodeling complex subunit SWI1